MKVTVRLFAILRERAGKDSVDLALADGATVADALAALGSEPGLDEVLGRLPVAMAVNREYASAETVLTAGDELALVPPVSGGSDVQARITDEPLSVETVSRAVGRPGAGALVIFQGTTRDVSRLDYEAYVEMAEERMRAIVSDCLSRYDLQAAVAEHRVGSVPLGEPSVLVAVSAAHRDEAFSGAREVIDRIKAEAPIWKREVEETESGDRGRWVEGATAARLTHVDESGRAQMVDVSAKEPTQRAARARAQIRMTSETARAVERGGTRKGDVLATARLAGVQAAKRTAELIPLAHPLPLSFVDVDARVDVAEGLVKLEAEARTVARTGVELEAMTAVAVSALTVYDMVKGVERGVTVEEIELIAKSGGRSGRWRRSADDRG